LNDEVADCPEEPGALEANVLNQPAGCLAPGDHRAFHSRGKSSRVKRCTFYDYDKMARKGCDTARLQAKKSGAIGRLICFSHGSGHQQTR
jgi:hypothetical protein